jgi:NitT/TauT family transport system permease protein
MKILKPFEKISRIYFLAIVGFWIILALSLWVESPEMIPKPLSVFKNLFEFLSSREFYADLIQSMILTGKAMFISIGIASLVAYASVLPIFKPIAMFLVKLRFMSLIGLVFVFTLVLHNGGEVKLSLLMFGIVPFFTLSLLSIIDKIGKNEFDLCRTLKYSNWQTLWELIIVGRMDYTIETIRANFAMAWLMITMVESFNMSEGGIGVMLFRLNKYNQLDKIFALQIVIFALGMLFDYGLQRLRYTLFPYIKLNEIK